MSNRNNQFLDDNIADPEQLLLSIFKTTATTVTQLYKESLNQSTRSYKNGYKQCLLDLMHFASIQHTQRHPSTTNLSPDERVALTLSELMTFYNTKQSQLNSMDENSNQNHSSMTNDDEIEENNTNTIQENNTTHNNPNTNTNNNNNTIDDDNNYQGTNTIDLASVQPIPSENKNINISFNNQPQDNEKHNLKANFNFSKGFTFRFNNDQLSPAFNNVNIFNPHDNMKRRIGNVPNTIDFLGRTFNFNNFSTENDVDLPPLKRNRWRRDDRMTE